MPLIRMIILDTSALIRFLVNDDITKSNKVNNLLKSGRELQVPDVVVLEINFILRKKYLVAKDVVCGKVGNVLVLPNVNSSREISGALKLYEVHKISLADCLIIACLKENDLLASFDKKLLKLSKVKSAF